jgi:phosphoribosyl-ATP pyrophosphohydrolase/phosphoribosyl-AMP cyclohydrolase
VSQDLVAGIVQDDRSGQVLMLGYFNDESLRLTRETGLVHFWSRSRSQLWMKGETSGHTLSVVSIDEDCDGDALLIRVIAAGPTCHTGSLSCFGSGELAGTLGALWKTIQSRKSERPEGSYTVSLLDSGSGKVGRKVVEEAVEVLVAAMSESDDRLAEESADLIYHLVVTLASREVALDRVMEVLAQRAQ